MKKGTFSLKRIISVTLILCAVLSLISSSVLADGAESERTGISIKEVAQKINGKVLIYPEGYYYSTQTIPREPTTLEAWVYLPKSSISAGCGVIFGNYAGYSQDAYLSYEIIEGGVPALTVSDNDGDAYTYEFSSAAVKPKEWTHIAIVYGGGDDFEHIYCYINGEMRHEFGPDKFMPIDKSFSDNFFSIAGDSSRINENRFTGVLGDIAIYSDVRSAERIRQDMISPDTADGALIAYYKLFGAENKKDVPDVSGNDYNMYYSPMWVSEKEMNAIRTSENVKYAYSIAFIPDTQYTTEYYPHNLSPIYDFIIENAQKRNIKYAVSLGDMTNDNTEEQWELVKEQTDRLNGIVPYTVLRGNHDVYYSGEGQEYFDKYYAKTDGYYYNHVKENGGFFDETSVKNTYLLFSAGKVDYMLINLDYGVGNGALEWANKLISEYPDRRVIIVTHAYLSPDGTPLAVGETGSPSSRKDDNGEDLNSGEDIWDKLIWEHENVAMIVSGHMHTNTIIATKAYGMRKNTVYQVLIDGQSVDSALEGVGLVGMMYFTEDGEIAHLEYYSTVLKSYLSGKRSRISFNFPSLGEDEEITPELTPLDIHEKKTLPDAVLYAIIGTVAALTACLTTVITVKKRKK